MDDNTTPRKPAAKSAAKPPAKSPEQSPEQSPERPAAKPGAKPAAKSAAKSVARPAPEKPAARGAAKSPRVARAAKGGGLSGAPGKPAALAQGSDLVVAEPGGIVADFESVAAAASAAELAAAIDVPGGALAGAPGGAPAVSRSTRTARVGLFVGREWSWPPEFIKAVERRDAGVVAEYAKIGAPRFDEPCPYDLCIDRISHEVPVYRSYLKHAALQGAAVVNDPFMWTADDKFFGASLARRLGVASPKTLVLPNRSYVPGIVPEESLRNLEYPLDWQGIVDYIGLPCILKDAHGGGWKEVYVCRSLDELIHHYNESGLLTMIVQEFIEWEHFVRCLVIGREHVLPMKYDPKARKYIVEHEHMSPELGARVVGDALKLVRALGYDMNSIEFAVRGGVPYAIDFMNPAPDMDIHSLTPEYFGWAVETMADLAVRLATAARDGAPQPRGGVWAMLERGGR